MTTALPEMIEALGLEVAAIRKRGGANQIELGNGERVGQAESGWLYRFIVSEDLNLRDETPVRLSIGDSDISGTLVSLSEGVLVVATEENVGPSIGRARLVTDDSFLVERLKERLEKVASGDEQFNRSSADRALGMANIHAAEGELDPLITADGRLNADQVSAIRQSLGSDTTFVWGPPGTGKTTTVARIVEAHYRAGRTVLLVSNTNVAVDTALEHVAKRLKDEEDFDKGLVLRRGTVVKEELRRLYGEYVVPEEVAARLGEFKRHEKAILTRTIDALTAEESSLVAALTDYHQLDAARVRLDQTEKSREETAHQFEGANAQVARHAKDARRLQDGLDRAEQMSGVRRFFAGVNVERITQQLRAAQSAHEQMMKTAAEMAAKLDEVTARLPQERTEVERLRQVTGDHRPQRDLEENAANTRGNLATARELLTAIEQELSELEAKILANCKILATTVYRTYLAGGTEREFDVVVIDEASMLMPPLVYQAAGLAKTAVTIAGDFRQLPPIVMSDSDQARKWLRKDAFEVAGIPIRVVKKQETPFLTSLGTQYRMHESICNVINDLFYADRPLRSGPEVNRPPLGVPLLDEPLLYIDTARFHPWASNRIGTFSLARNLVLHLADGGLLPAEGEPNNAIGVVAPYTSQTRLIQSLLEDRLGTRAAGLAATVHRFQGNEKSAMILDLTDSFGKRLGRFLRAKTLEEDGARLLNVAMSRAKQHAILIANFEYLRSKAPTEGFVQRLLDHYEREGAPLAVDNLLPLAERDWMAGLHKVEPTAFQFPQDSAGAFTDRTFYPAFLEDLKAAKESIVIFSPFITAPGASRWADFIRAAVKRGISVRILAKPPTEIWGGSSDEVAEVISQLRELGATVDLRRRMHEKIAVIDSSILWHGSLNILSHRDTHESMLRIETAEACRQVGRFVSTPTAPGGRDQTMLLAEAENPDCPICGGPTVWNVGRFGVWYECEDPECTGKVNARTLGRRSQTKGHTGNRRSTPERHRKTTNSTRPCPEPGCNGHLVHRQGRYGPFLGCSNYPKCRHTERVS